MKIARDQRTRSNSRKTYRVSNERRETPWDTRIRPADDAGYARTHANYTNAEGRTECKS